MTKQLLAALAMSLIVAVTPGCKAPFHEVDKSGNDGQIDERKPQGTVTVMASPQNGGTVSGSGTYDWRDKITIKATPASGWKFLKWQDGSTAATRIISVPRGSVTYTASFSSINSGTVTTKASPTEGGSVTGGGMFPIGQVISLNAVPNLNWSFEKWQDGNTNTPLTFVVPTGTFAITAFFKTNVITYGNLVVRAEPAIGGTTTGAGTYQVGQTVSATATPNENWSFSHWQDGKTDNPRNVVVPTGTLLLTATFTTNAPVTGVVDAVISPPQGGSVSGIGTYPLGQTITLTAVPNPGWRFTQWQDGTTTISRTITIQGGQMTVTAFFQQFGTLSLVSEPPNGGTTTGSGTYAVGQTVTINAIPATNFTFAHWQDNNTSASRTVTVPGGSLLMTATFSTAGPAQGTIACNIDPPTGGTITGCGTFNVGQNVTILAMPAANWRFDQWENGSATASRSVPVPAAGTTTTVTASFVQFGNITVSAEPINGGSVSGGGSYAVGEVVTVTATPAANWSFNRWQDGNTNRSRQVTVGPGNVQWTGTFVTNAPPTAGGASINWTPSPSSPEAKQFAVKWGITSGNYTNSFTTNVTSVRIGGLDTNRTYYFAIQAMSTNGMNSSPSCEVAWKYPNIVSCGL